MTFIINSAERKLQYDFFNSWDGQVVVSCYGGGLGRLEPGASSADFATILLDEKYPQLRSQGKIQYGEGSRFDDRKYRFRFATSYFNAGMRVGIHFGLTTYPEVCADILRDKVENLRLQEEGKSVHGDRWIHFARSLGVAFIPVTLDGSVFLGKRESSLYPGYLNAAAGNVEYHGVEPKFSVYENQAKVELCEEFGKDLAIIGPLRFAGIASNPIAGDGDMVFVARINVRDSYFESGTWLEHRIDCEHHSELVKIRDVADRDCLLESHILRGKEYVGVMASTSLGLDFLKEEDFLVR